MVTYVQDKKDVSAVVNLIDKGYLLVGKYLKSVLEEKNKNSEKKINYKDPMESQRKYCWEKWRVSNLIQSLIMFDDSIPEITVYRSDSNSQFRKVIDGQQRLTSIYMFISDMIPLDMSRSIFNKFLIEDKEHTTDFMHGKIFSELPELWQDIIRNKSLRFICANNCDEDTAEKLFVQYNSNPKTLRPAEVRRAGMGSLIRKSLNDIRSADWLLHVMTPLAVEGNQCDEILCHAITLLENMDNPIALTSKNVNQTIYKYREDGLPVNTISSLVDINKYLNEFTGIWIDEIKTQDEIDRKVKSGYNTYRFKNHNNKNIFNKTNIVMLMISAHIAIKANVNVDDFAKWATSFFKFQTEEWRDACGVNGDKKPSDEDAVTDRMRLILASMASLHEKNTNIEEIDDSEIDMESTVLDEVNNKDEEDNEDIYPNTEFIGSMLDEISDPFGDEIDYGEASGL